MQSNHFLKAGALAILLVIALILSWEFYLRNKGYRISYDDGKVLWSDVRVKVYKSQEKATVFIGSSRIKYDLDIPTWKKLTGEDAIQLAIEGNTPRPVLHHLAMDEDFKGKLIVDVTEPLFFAGEGPNSKEVAEFIDYHDKRTPSEKFSSILNYPLEKNFVFLNKDYFSINGLLYSAGLPARKDVFVFPYFTPEFAYNSHERQSWMSDKFTNDTNLQNSMKKNWQILMGGNRRAPARGDTLNQMLQELKADVNRIIRRGGQVLFVRTPSSGPMLEGEMKGFPREIYWDQILSVTGSPGIHFLDHPEIASFVCPEWSHLSKQDAITYTTHLVSILQHKGWKFSANTITSAN